MTGPHEVAYDLTPSCPGCGADLDDYEQLCGCDNEDTGPLCVNRCCPNEHRTNQPWRRAA